jgi:hypothetical protein
LECRHWLGNPRWRQAARLAARHPMIEAAGKVDAAQKAEARSGSR